MDPGSQTVLAPPSLVAVVGEGGRGGSSGRLVSPPLLLPSVVPSSVPPAALAGVVPLVVPVPLPPPDPPPSALAAVELASDRPRPTPTVAVTLPTMQSAATKTNPPSKPTIERHIVSIVSHYMNKVYTNVDPACITDCGSQIIIVIIIIII